MKLTIFALIFENITNYKVWGDLGGTLHKLALKNIRNYIAFGDLGPPLNSTSVKNNKDYNEDLDVVYMCIYIHV